MRLVDLGTEEHTTSHEQLREALRNVLHVASHAKAADLCDGDWVWLTEAERALAAPVAGGLDVERLMVAVFNADQPGDWPTWQDYIGAFGSAGAPPWRRKAEAIAREYAALDVLRGGAEEHTTTDAQLREALGQAREGSGLCDATMESGWTCTRLPGHEGVHQ